MKNFLATAATALVLGTTAYADGHTAAFTDLAFDESVNLNASELIGMRVYATESDINNETMITADGEKEWDDIGEINEIVLTRNGEVQSVIVGVGGFIGVGERDVAISMSQLKFVQEEGDADDFFLVVNASLAGVKEAPEYKYLGQSETSMKSGTAMDTETTMTADGDAPMKAQDDRAMLTPPAIERDGYITAKVDDLTAEDLTGARVYGPNDEDVGEIGELLLTDDGKMDRVVIDVGGFLGMGEHHVAVTFEELQIVRMEDGSDLRVYIDSTQETLEQQPEYQG
ncbi:PRC-barrel domain-containing protein [Sulfitobacter sp. F26204]|uniref:PRC-barrel domain-containing protein n=1 Tax=Sulfitobacter sp. F26204 TaxID=2996014 RepID=UPI00225E1D22|nr:PRC-barrel domain-containing protein [Sulfitobacter sp. F26204]MCX7559271.1 PRC-barrel domain-containing protein [Sulfitobacter sp. F26204]